MARKLIVEILGDASSLEKSYRRSAQATDKFGRNIERTGRGAVAASLSFKGLGRSIGFASGAFIGGAGFIAGAKASVAAASSLNEQQSKTNAVFLQSAKAVTDWSKTTVNSMGLAQVEALQTASSFGALLAPIGIQGELAAQQSEKLTQLGADLASFYDTDVQSALDAIRSGLVGESEPLRRYGVQLSEARVQAEAFAETGKTSAAQLTNQDKVLARIAITFRDTAKAQGDFAKTSGGFANQQRILKANILELETAIGVKIVPTLTDLITKINEFAADPEKTHKVSEGFRIFGEVVDGVTMPLIESEKALIKVDTAIVHAGNSYIRGALPVFFDSGPKIDDVAASLGGVADGLKAISDAQAAVTGVNFAAVNKAVQQSFKGTTFTLTAAQRQDLSFAQDPTSVANITTQRDRQRRRFEFAMRQVHAGNARFFALAKDAAAQVASFDSQLASIAASNAADAEAAAKATREKSKAAAEARRQAFTDLLTGVDLGVAGGPLTLGQVNKAMSARFQSGVFGLLGLTPAGESKGPSRGNLQSALKSAQSAIAGGPLDTKAMQSRLAGLRTVLNSEFGKLTRDTKIKVQDFLDALAGKKTGGAATPRRAASISQLIAGTGISGAGLRQLEFNLAGAHLTTPVVVHTQVNLDGREVARNTTTHQQRDQRRRPTQTRGRPL